MDDIRYNTERRGCLEVDPMKVLEQLIQEQKPLSLEIK
jgi:hypothetical protein